MRTFFALLVFSSFLQIFCDFEIIRVDILKHVKGKCSLEEVFP